MNLQLYKGIIEGVRLQNNNNTYAVRIEPLMRDINDITLLPFFPSFFKNALERYEEKEWVWVLAEEDFQVGYVIGLCEDSKGKDISFLVEKIQEAEKNLNLPVSLSSNLGFSLVQDVFIDFYDIDTLISGRISNTGAMMIFGPNGEFFLITSDAKLDLNKTTLDVNDLAIVADNNLSVTCAQIEEKAEKRKEIISSKKEETVAGDSSESVLGNKVEVYQNKDETVLMQEKRSIGMGQKETIVSGGSDIKVIVGNYTITTMAGKVMINGGGGMQVTLGPGGLNIVSAGAVSLTAPQVSLNTANLTIKALTIIAPKGFTAPTGSGPFCALPICPFTGLPHLGNTFAGV